MSLLSYWDGSAMHLEDLRLHLDTRLDKLEDKLDNHLERIAKSEASIEWLKGHVRVSISILLASLTGLATVAYQFLGGKP